MRGLDSGDDRFDVEMITGFELGNGSVRNERVRPAEPEVRPDRLAKAARDRPVFDGDDTPPLRPLTLQELGVKRLQVSRKRHFRARDFRGNRLRLLELIACGPDGIGGGEKRWRWRME